MKKLIALIVAALFVGLGCATTSEQRVQEVTKITVQYVTLKLVQDKPDLAAAIVQAADVVEQGAPADLVDFQALLTDALPSPSDPADQLLLASLVNIAVQEVDALTEAITNGREDDVLPSWDTPFGQAVTEVLGWMRDAASLVASLNS